MKTYFEYKGYKVVDFINPEFATYSVEGTSRCFNNLTEAICYAIACGESVTNTEQEIISFVDTFLTMIRR